MLKKIFIVITMLFSILPLFSNTKVLLITNNDDVYNTVLSLDNNDENVNIINLNDNFNESNYSGSFNYLEKELVDSPKAVVYLNVDSLSEIKAYGFTPGLLPDLEITKQIIQNLKIESTVAKDFPLYITKIKPTHELVKLYNSYDIPIILISGNINLKKIMASLTFKNEQAQSFYYIMSFFYNAYYINSRSIILINAFFVVLILILISLYSKRLKFHIKNNKHYSITIPLKIVCIFIFYFISTMVITYISDHAGQGFINRFPKSIFIIKNLVLFFIYGISFQIIKDEAFSKSPYYYSYISFFISVLTYFIISSIFLPLGLYMIWLIIITILFLIFRSKKAKSLLLILSPTVLIILLFVYLTPENPQVIQLLINSKYTGNILLTLIITPYIFLQESYYRFSHRKNKYVKNSKDIVLSILTLTLTITMIFILIELNKNSSY